MVKADASTPTTMPTAVVQWCTDAFNSLRWLKQEQRATTNYIMLIYGGLIAVRFSEAGKPLPLAVFLIATVTVGLLGTYLLRRMDLGMRRFRAQIRSLGNKYLSRADADILQVNMAQRRRRFYEFTFHLSVYLLVAGGGVFTVTVMVWPTLWPAPRVAADCKAASAACPGASAAKVSFSGDPPRPR